MPVKPNTAIERVSTKDKPSTYAKAGVDVRKEDLAIKGIESWVTKTFKFREGKKGQVMAKIGLFANLIDMGDYALALTTDGVGSKVLVAQKLGKYDTIGIDLVAMNVNDLICIGAEPIAMVDYLAMRNVDDKIAKEISIGLYEGAKQAEIAIVGGETATLPDVITGLENNGFDLAGTALGFVRKDMVVTGESVVAGDAVVGLASSGVHSNGLTLARKVVPLSMWNELLKPTKIYVKEVLTLLREYRIHGMANITGGGMLNLLRLNDVGFALDKLPEPQMIFKRMQELGKISDGEMYKTFNMGVGFCLVTDEKNAKAMVEKYGKEYKMSIIGKVIEKPEVRVTVGGKEIVLERSIY